MDTSILKWSCFMVRTQTFQGELTVCRLEVSLYTIGRAPKHEVRQAWTLWFWSGRFVWAKYINFRVNWPIYWRIISTWTGRASKHEEGQVRILHTCRHRWQPENYILIMKKYACIGWKYIRKSMFNFVNKITDARPLIKTHHIAWDGIGVDTET